MKTTKITLPIIGLSCASCAINAETTIKHLKGVENAVVNFANGAITIEYIPEIIAIEDCKKALQNIGYDLIIEKEKLSAAAVEGLHEEKVKTLQKKMFYAILLTLPIIVIGMFFPRLPFAQPIMVILATPVVFWYGRDFFINRLFQRVKIHFF